MNLATSVCGCELLKKRLRHLLAGVKVALPPALHIRYLGVQAQVGAK